MSPQKNTGGLVYSTDAGRMCPACRQPIAQCRCNVAVSPPPANGVVLVSRETKGRKGKGVTVVRGVPLDPSALAELARQLRTACGCGGTAKDGTIEVQGDHCDKVMALLRQQGFNVKRAGG